MQGLILQVGAFARTVAPIVITSVGLRVRQITTNQYTMQFFKKFGPQAAWLLEISVISMSIMIIIVTYRQLIPLQVLLYSPSSCVHAQIVADNQRTPSRQTYTAQKGRRL